MATSLLERIASTRFLVGALGERAGWWPSRFTDDAAKRSLELVFPRTWVRSSLESVVEVARRDHDALVSRQAFHLFRLPPHLEDRLAAHLADPATVLEWPHQQVEAILTQLNAAPGSNPAGPLCLGKPGRLASEGAYREIAGVYAKAFSDGVRVVPYFEGET